MTAGSVDRASLQRCPNCGREYSTAIHLCPHCKLALVPADEAPKATIDAAPQAESSRRPTVITFAVWAVAWAAIAVVVYLWVVPRSAVGLILVAIAGAVSLGYMLRNLREAWVGEIVEIRTEQVKVEKMDGSETETVSEDRDFAYVRLSSGKTKRLEKEAGWKVGDRLEKRPGYVDVRRVR